VKVNTKELLSAAAKAANRVAKRCWSVPVEDLHQEAAALALTAVKNYDPAKGALGGYIYRAASRHLINFVYDSGTCVGYKHRRTLLADVRSVDLADASSLASKTDTEAEVASARWRASVRARVAELAGEDAEAVVLCLIDDNTPTEASRRVGAPLLRVLHALGRVKEAMPEDETLINLWRDAP